ncbi:MAG: zinc ribbon domain-containing protein [Acidobacteriaceae bacterium]
MHPDLAKLVVLQEFDIEAKRLRDQIAALPRQLATLELKSAAAEGQRAIVLDLIAKEDVLRRRLESDIADQRQKLARTQKKIDAATNTVQVTALEHEAAFARAEINRMEDAELESMERAEALDGQQACADQAIAEAAQTLQRERARTEDLLARDRAALAEVDAKRAALRAEIAQSPTGDDSLSTYDRISRSKGTAVSQALNQKCSACQMMVRPQRWNDLRDNTPGSTSSQTLMTCENCGHLLYYDPARDAPQPKPVQSESIAAQIVRSL